MLLLLLLLLLLQLLLLLLLLLMLLQLLLLQLLLLQLLKFPKLWKNLAAHILNRTCAHARAAQDVVKESAAATIGTEASQEQQQKMWHSF